MSRHKPSGWETVRQQLSRSQVRIRRRRLRARFEALEPRTMLDAAPGLPQALVVGRTLSSYTVGGIHNRQETITYTVYNEQADPETGVLLATTLASGVSFASATGAPNRSGQDLAWNLGT